MTLFARITKLGWFDMVKEEYVLHNVINDVTSFLQVSIVLIFFKKMLFTKEKEILLRPLVVQRRTSVLL